MAEELPGDTAQAPPLPKPAALGQCPAYRKQTDDPDLCGAAGGEGMGWVGGQRGASPTLRRL